MRLRAILAASVLVLTGCSAEVSDPIESIKAGQDPFSQEVVWTDCEDGFECAVIGAPLDWLNPSDDVIPLKLIRSSSASGKPVIFVNPGGPGVSGVNWMRDGYEYIGTEDLRSQFQLVSFDPRGAGDSAGVSCPDQELKDTIYYEQSPHVYGSEEDLAYSRELLALYAQDCLAQGFDPSYFNTQMAARDLELMRALVGDVELNYLGFSYGTELGSTYAALFPDRVGNMVLDGAIDPTISDAESLMGQVVGFDSAFRAYLEDCLTRLNCPFVGDVDTAIGVVANFLEERESSALPTQLDRDLSLSATLTGIIAALYSKDSWIYLTQAFVEALDGDGTTMLMLADFYNDRDIADGYLSNQNEANLAIGCADGRIESEGIEALNARFVEASAVFGKYFQHPDLACENWPKGKSEVELDFTVKLANPPLVVGTTGDPATPYAQAVALSELLDGATLLTLEGEGHTAYGQNICIDAIVEAYFRGEDIGEGNKTCIG